MHLLPANVELHTFLPGLFSNEPVVVDFGLNQGNFAMAMIREYGASVYGAEPSSELFKNLPVDPKLVAKNVAISGTDGTAQLGLYTKRCCSLYPGADDANKGSEPVTLWSLATFLTQCGIERVDLLKVDIEGAECDLFETASDADLRRCGQIAVEFHDFLIESLGPRVEAIKARLAACGFHRINFSLNNGDVLFVRRDLLPTAVALVLRGPYKYAMGANRRLRRLIANPRD